MGYKCLQEVTRDNKGLLWVARGYRGSKRVKMSYRGLQWVSGGYKGLEGYI